MVTAADFDRDYARRLTLDPNELTAELSALGIGRDGVPTKAVAPGEVPEPGHLLPGVSVIIPTYRGSGRIMGALMSLVDQDLDPSRFEIIVIPNGPDDGTRALLAAFVRSQPEPSVRVIATAPASAGGARNIGLAAARFAHVTFVDDDDQVQRSYLSSALAMATPEVIVVSPLVDVHLDGTRDANTMVTTRLSALVGRPTPLHQVPWVLGLNACKLVPTSLAKAYRFREDLASGEDLVYFAELLHHPQLSAVAAREGADTAYLRALRDDSISRRALDVDFAVDQRLSCIRALSAIDVDSVGGRAAIESLQLAQTGHILRFLEQYPDERETVIERIAHTAPNDFPWESLNRGKARDLAFVYCFAPYSDTSAVVAAKAIAERGLVVDVVTNDMSAVRRLDPAVASLARRWIDESTVISATPSFAGWEPISDFATKALAAAELRNATKGPYRTVYSRALWVGSHVAAALFKLHHWQVRWSAEFSDPLRRGADGVPRSGALTDNDVARRLKAGLQSRGFGHLQVDTLFDLVEQATFVLADEVIFTNTNQFDYMLSLTRDPRLAEVVAAKARIREHPTPAPTAYQAVPTSYQVPDGVVNIGYFGSFYPNRGIGDVLTALLNLPMDLRRQVRIHIFCNVAKDVKAQVAALGLGNVVYVNNYLSYMEFLNATTLFDVLLVNDVTRDERLPINPFLPSKLSDYRGSGRSVWALIDEGSAMSRMPLTYVTPVGDSARIAHDLAKIIAQESRHPTVQPINDPTMEGHPRDQ